MNYQKIYDNLIKTCKNRILINDVYYERHHIVPKSIGGSNKKQNLIHLTAREHFLAHWLLWRIYQNTEYSKSISYAFHCMCTLNNSYIKSSRGYMEARESFSKIRSIEMSGKKFSEEHRKNIGVSSKGRISIHRRKVCIDGKIYDALHIASQILNVPPMTIRNRLVNPNFKEWNYV